MTDRGMEYLVVGGAKAVDAAHEGDVALLVQVGCPALLLRHLNKPTSVLQLVSLCAGKDC